MSKIGVDEFEAMAQTQVPLVAQLRISVERLEARSCEAETAL